MVNVWMVGGGFQSYAEKFSDMPQVGHTLSIAGWGNSEQEYVIYKIDWQYGDRKVRRPVAFVKRRSPGCD